MSKFKISNYWWSLLTEQERLKCRSKYEKIRQENYTRRFPFPNIKDTMNSKISQLTENQIYTVFRFTATDEFHYHWNYTDEQRIKNKIKN